MACLRDLETCNKATWGPPTVAGVVRCEDVPHLRNLPRQRKSYSFNSHDSEPAQLILTQPVSSSISPYVLVVKDNFLHWEVNSKNPPYASSTVALDDMQHAAVGAETVKEQVVDKVPKRIKELRFGIL